MLKWAGYAIQHKVVMISLTDAENQIHCHLVMALVCLPLERLSCKNELIQAFIDVV